MEDNNKTTKAPLNGSLVFGGILILLGVIFLGVQLVGSLFRIDLGRFLWPFFILVPGATLFILGLVARNGTGEALVIVGSIISMSGLLILFQNVTGMWASWAYAWALVAPTSVGLGLLAYGMAKGKPEKVQAGKSLTGIGLVIFLVGGIFFELIIGLNGFGLGRFGWPLLLIGLGALWLFRALVHGRRAE